MPGIVRNGRKRSATSLSEDEDLSDVSSSVSVGSKRVRYSRNASRNPIPTNGNGNPQRTQNAPGKDLDQNSEEVFQPGSIVRVKLVNFVTYTSAEFLPGPSLNMIIGPNGTGKSTLVCAIGLGLGSSPGVLGRSKDIGEFVKHGCAEAEIEIELAAASNQTHNPVICRKIKKEGGKTVFFIDNRIASQREVKDLAESYSIQINNLIQFMPQDRVFEFAKIQPVGRLAETQRAAAPEEMVEWHAELITLRKEQKELEIKQKENQDNLATTQRRQNATREDVNKHNERLELQMRAETLVRCRPIIELYIQKQQHEAAKANVARLKDELAQLKADSEPARQAQQDIEIYRDQVNQVVKFRKDRVATAIKSTRPLLEQINKEKGAIVDFTAKVKAEQEERKKGQQDIVRLNEIIKRLNRSHQERPEDPVNSELEGRKSELRRQIRALEVRDDEIGGEMTESISHFRQRQPDLKAKHDARNKLDTQSGQREISLKSASADTAKAWQWIEKNLDSLSLKGKVYGPPILTCTVSDPRYADVVESQLQPGDLTAITCTNTDDTKIISNIVFNQLKLHSITIRTCPRPLSAYQPPVDQAELQQYGFDGYILEYIQGEEAVLAMLCENRQLHRSAYASRPLSEQQFARLQSSPINRWVSGREVYQITRRREYGQTSTSTIPLRNARYFTDQGADPEEKRQLDADIAVIQRELRSYKEEHDRAKEAQAKIREEKQTLVAEQEQILQQLRELRKAYAQWEDIPRKIAQKQSDLEELTNQVNTTSDRIRAINAESEQASLNVANMTIEYAKIVTSLRASYESLVEAEIRLLEATSEAKAYKADNARIIQALATKETEFKEARGRVRELRARYQVLFQNATQTLNDLSEPEEEVTREFQDKTMEELEVAIDQVNSRLRMMAEANPHAVQAFERQQRDIDRLESSLADVQSRFETIAVTMAEIRAQWEPKLEALIRQIDANFSYNFQQIGCSGSVSLSKDENNFEDWGIEIQVSFREGESLSILDSHRQSGGERSVSTVFYLMALQDLSRAPFRVVDEINQAMDRRNERIVHERMVDIACSERTSQYFLVTPKLLNDLKYHPKMKVHCIASGEWMPDDAELENVRRASGNGAAGKGLNFAELARLALRVKRGVRDDGRGSRAVSAAGW